MKTTEALFDTLKITKVDNAEDMTFNDGLRIGIKNAYSEFYNSCVKMESEDEEIHNNLYDLAWISTDAEGVLDKEKFIEFVKEYFNVTRKRDW